MQLERYRTENDDLREKLQKQDREMQTKIHESMIEVNEVNFEYLLFWKTCKIALFLLLLNCRTQSNVKSFGDIGSGREHQVTLFFLGS